MDKIIDKAQKIVEKLKYKKPFISYEENEQLEEKTKHYINYIFKELKSICSAYPQAWPTQEVYLDSKRSWYKSLRESEINTSVQIELGLKKLRARSGKDAQFIPASGQFIELCKPTPEDVGLKSSELAFIEACEQSNPTASKIFSHATVKLARDLTGTFYLMSNPRSKTFPVFEKHYAECVKLFLHDRILNQIERESDYEKQVAIKSEIKEEYKSLTNHSDAIKQMKLILK